MAGFDGGGVVGSRSRLEGALYVPNEAARLALSPSKDGQLVLQVDTNTLYSWDAGGSTYTEVGGALTPASVSDTNTVDHTVTTGVLSSDVLYQDSNSVNLSDDASGLKADVVTQNTNSVNISEDASGVKADLNIQDTASVDLSVDASGLKADVLPAGVDHDSLLNTHNLTTDINHNTITNNHNLTSDIDHDQLTNYAANEHFTEASIDHENIQNKGTNSHSEIDDFISSKAQSSGLASLDGSGKVPASQLPSSVMEYKGSWNASTNTPTLADGTGTNGDVYLVNVAGTQDLGSGSITFAQGDWVIYNGSIWEKSINNNAVISVNTQTGAVVLDADDISDTSTTNKFTTSSNLTKLGHISVTQAVDLDTMESDIAGKQEDVITTRGDVVIGDSSGDAERLAIGNADQVLASDGTDVSWVDAAGGSEIKETQSGHGFGILDPIYHNGSTWVLAKADSADTVATHIVKEDVDPNTFKAIQFGRITTESHGLTPGDYHWLSTTGLGFTVTSEPTSGYSCPLYYVLDDDNVIALVYRPNAIGDGVASDSEIGSIIAFAGTSTPTGFLACEGQAVSRSTYSKLFAAISTTWGVGDGSTTFNLPDGRSGFLVGAGEGDEFTVNTDRSVGDYDDDQLQGHEHTLSTRNNTPYGNANACITSSTPTYTTVAYTIGLKSDGTNGTPRTGTETKPNSLAVKFCIRYEPKAALQGVYEREIVYLKDIKSSGTNGGDFTQGAWRTRVLNTTENSQTWCGLSSNQFTLEAGKYKIRAKAPAYRVVGHQTKLRNITDSTDDIIGNAMNDSAASGIVVSVSDLMGIIEITSSKTFEIQHYCSSTRATNGFGNANSFGVSEIYTQVEIERIGD